MYANECTPMNARQSMYVNQCTSINVCQSMYVNQCMSINVCQSMHECMARVQHKISVLLFYRIINIWYAPLWGVWIKSRLS